MGDGRQGESGAGGDGCVCGPCVRSSLLRGDAHVRGAPPPVREWCSNLVGSDASTEPAEQVQEKPRKIPKGIYGVTYQRYPIVSYVSLPAVLQPFVALPFLDHVLLIGRPTGDKSGGLDGYRAVCPKRIRREAPFLIVLDDEGRKPEDEKYIWVEFPLADVFKLDVSELRSMDDYAKLLSRKGRWNFKDRQKKFHDPTLLSCEYVPLPLGDEARVDELWPLYRTTGEANGFCVLSETEFRDFHLKTENLTLMLIRDVASGELVTFCTGLRVGDTLMPLWCGTNYDNALARKCSTYFNMLYEFVRVAIEDPSIKWVDLGASRRQAKTSIGFKGYPISAYIRCKNVIMQALVETMAADYFKPAELIADP